MKITVSSLFLLIFLIIITAMCLLMVYFVFRTTYYVNYLTECNPKAPFCYIKKIKLSIPNEFLGPLDEIAQREGTRVEIYKKRQKAVSIQDFDRADMLWARYQESRDRTISTKNRAESLIKS